MGNPITVEPGEDGVRCGAWLAELEAALSLARKVFNALDWKKDKRIKTEVQYGINGLRVALDEERRRSATAQAQRQSPAPETP